MKEKEKKKIEQPAPETLDDKDLENVTGGVVRIILPETENPSFTGGIVGFADKETNISNCYNASTDTSEGVMPVGAITEA